MEISLVNIFDIVRNFNESTFHVKFHHILSVQNPFCLIENTSYDMGDLRQRNGYVFRRGLVITETVVNKIMVELTASECWQF